MKAILRFLRWTAILIVLLCFWVGSYLKWRLSDSDKILSQVVIHLPDWLPDWAEKAYLPLAKVDGWITGEQIAFNHWDIAYPLDQIEKSIHEFGESVQEALKPREK